MLSVSLFAGKKNKTFSGDWELDKEKTDLPEGDIYLAEIKLELEGDSLFTTRTYVNDYDGGYYPFDENLTLDGKEHDIYIYNMPRTASANWSDDDKKIIINSTITFYGNEGEVDIITKEIFSIDEKGDYLVINLTSKTGEEETKGVLYFRKKESAE